MYKPFVDRHTGIAAVAGKQGDKQRERNAADIEAKNKMMEICLNCDSPVCKGCGNKSFTYRKKKR